MPTCISTRTGGSAACGGEISPVPNSDAYSCSTCRRRWSEEDLVFIRKVNDWDEMQAARKEQERKSEAEKRKPKSKRVMA